MAYIEFNIIIALIILGPAFLMFQAKSPKNSLFWFLISSFLSNIYLSLQENNGIIDINETHLLSNLFTLLSLLISCTIIWILINKTTNDGIRKIYPSIVVSEAFIISLGVIFFLYDSGNTPLLILGSLLFIAGVFTIITENNLIKTLLGLLFIQNGTHFVLNHFDPEILLGYTIMLNILQIFATSIISFVIYKQFENTHSIKVEDISFLKF